MNRGPIKPEDVEDLKTSSIPDEVFEVFNELIAKNISGGRAFVKQKEVEDRLVERLGCAREKLFKERWLDVEESYRKVGWSVEYDKPGYNESYEASFTFVKPRKGPP